MKYLKRIGILILSISLLAGTISWTPTKAEDISVTGITHGKDKEVYTSDALSVRTDTQFFHSGTQSVLLEKKDRTESQDATGAEVYAIDKTGVTTDFTLTWEAWYRSCDSEGFLRVDVKLYDEDGNCFDTLIGNKVMLSRQAYASEWQKVQTSEVVPYQTARVSFVVEVLAGYNKVWVDDFSCLVTETYEKKIVDYCDFHGQTERGEEPEWVTVGKQASHKITGMIPQYDYRIEAAYTASEDAQATLTYYDVKDKEVGRDAVTIYATEEESTILLQTTAYDAEYAVFSVPTKVSLDDFYVYETATKTTGEAGWTANVLWYPEEPEKDCLADDRYFRYTFTVEKEVESFYFQVCADDDTWERVYINGNYAGTPLIAGYREAEDKRSVNVYSFGSRVTVGENVIALNVRNAASYGGVIFEGWLNYTDGTSVHLKSNTADVRTAKPTEVSGSTWYAKNLDDSSWKRPRNLGVPPYTKYLKNTSFCYDYTNRMSITTQMPSEEILGGEEHVTTVVCESVENAAYFASDLTGYLYLEGTHFATIPIQAQLQEDEMSFTYTIPDYLPAGVYHLQLKQDKLKILNETTNNTLCAITLREPKKAIASGEVRKENGAVRLQINGEITSPILYLQPHHTNIYYNYEKLSGIRQSGIELYATYSGYLDGSDGRMIWLSDGSVDTEAFDKDIYRVLDLNPDAYVIANICLDAPQWWLNAHPDECLADEKGNLVTYQDASGTGKRVSYASETYRKEASEVVQTLVRHMQSAPYRNRICGVKLVAGRTYEWMLESRDNNTGEFKHIDYSKAMQTSFKAATGYTVPTIAERTTSTYNTVLNPATQQNVIAYNTYQAQCVTDSFLTYAKAVKDVAPNWLVGGYNGYLWFEESAYGMAAGHSTVADILESEYVDYISSPVNYSERINGYKTGYMTLTDSVAAHGKLYLLEQDNRTLYGRVENEAKEDDPLGAEPTMEGTINQLTRDMTTNFVSGNGFWFYDMEGGWFSDAQIAEQISRIKDEYEQSEASDLSSNSEVAIYVERDFYNQLRYDSITSNGSNSAYMVSQIYNKQRLELSKMGTSYDTFAIEDLCSQKVDVDWNRYKLHIVLSPISLTKSERAAIDKKLKKDGKVILWVYMAGISDGESMQASHVSELTDINCKLMMTTSWKTQATVCADNVLGDAGESYGVDYGYAYQTPLLYTDDAAATVLAQTVVKGYRYPTAAMKNVKVAGGTYTSVYSGVSNVKAESLRNLCELAGVHLYTDDRDAVVETNQSYVSFYSQRKGTRTISLPKRADVYDVLQGKWIARDKKRFTVTLDADETGLYRIVSHKKHSYQTHVYKGTPKKDGIQFQMCNCGEIRSVIAIPQASKITLKQKRLRYNGKKQQPKVIVRDCLGNRISSSQYKVVCTARKSVGKYTLKIVFDGTHYTGVKTLKWSIVAQKNT